MYINFYECMHCSLQMFHHVFILLNFTKASVLNEPVKNLRSSLGPNAPRHKRNVEARYVSHPYMHDLTRTILRNLFIFHPHVKNQAALLQAATCVLGCSLSGAIVTESFTRTWYLHASLCSLFA